MEKNRRIAKTTQLVCPVLQVRNINVCAVLVLRAKTANTVGIKYISSHNMQRKEKHLILLELNLSKSRDIIKLKMTFQVLLQRKPRGCFCPNTPPLHNIRSEYE